MADDAVALRCASEPAAELLFDRDGARCYSAVHFTPLLPISFKLDREIFGVDAFGSGVINVIVIASTTIAALAAFSAYAPVSVAGPLVTAWAMSPPATSVVGWLVTRQWVAGLLFSLVALAAIRRGQREGTGAWRPVALVAYGGALLWKDVFLPLPLIAVVLGEAPLRDRIRDGMLLGGVAVVYFAWRWTILGGLGGYGELELSAPTIARGLVRSFPLTSEALLGWASLWWLPFVLAGWRGAAVLAFVWIVTVAPIAVVLPSASPDTLGLRYLFPVSCVFFWGLACGLGKFPRPFGWIAATVIAALVAGVSLPRSMTVLDELRTAGREGEDLIRFLKSTSCDDVIVVGLAHTPQWYVTGMDHLRKENGKEALPRTRLVTGEAALASRALLDLDAESRRCAVTRSVGGEFLPVGDELGERISAWGASRHGRAPTLDARRDGRDVSLYWTGVSNAVGYRLFYGEEPDLYAAALPVPGTHYPARNLSPGRYCFRVAAELEDGELGRLSDEVCIAIEDR